MQEVVIERRHQIEVGDALGGDQLEGARDFEPRQTDESAADERHGKERAHAHRVVERHDAERTLVRGVEILRDVRQRGGALGAVPARHPLGPCGSAGGVEHDRPRLGVYSRANVVRASPDQPIEW